MNKYYFNHICRKLKEYGLSQETINMLTEIKDKKYGFVCNKNEAVLSIIHMESLSNITFINKIIIKDDNKIELYCDAKYAVKPMMIFNKKYDIDKFNASQIIKKLLNKLEKNNYIYELNFNLNRVYYDYKIIQYKFEFNISDENFVSECKKIIHIINIFDVYNYKMFDIFLKKYKNFLEMRG